MPGSAFLGIGGVVVAILFCVIAASMIQQAWRAWHDPDWEPYPGNTEPRNVLVNAVVMSSVTVMTTCSVILYWMPGAGRALVVTAAIVITLCLLVVFAGVGTAIKIRNSGRPAFLIPPRVRRSDRLQAEMSLQTPVDPQTAVLPAEPLALGEDSLLEDGCRLGDDLSRHGYLQLTTERIIFQRFGQAPRSSALFDQTRIWSLTNVRTVRPRARRTLSIDFADGTEERFLLQRGNRDRWLSTIANARGIAPQ